MASLAIIIFVLAIIGTLFYLPFKVQQFSKNEILNNILRRGCIFVALLLLSLGTAMLATIADNGGIELSREIFRFLWFINWSCYLLMVFIIKGIGQDYLLLHFFAYLLFGLFTLYLLKE